MTREKTHQPVTSALGKEVASSLQYPYLAAEGAHCPGNAQVPFGLLRCGTGSCGSEGHQAKWRYPSNGHSKRSGGT